MIGMKARDYVQDRLDALQLDKNTKEYQRDQTIKDIDRLHEKGLQYEHEVNELGIEIEILEKEIAFMKKLLAE